jgi:hypothetical protein
LARVVHVYYRKGDRRHTLTVYHVIHREIMVTTYEVEAEDEEDAIDLVQSGAAGMVEGRDTEPVHEGDDPWIATEVEEETQ